MGVKAAKALNKAKGKKHINKADTEGSETSSLPLYESMWAIKQQYIAKKCMLEKHKVLERLLALSEKGEPLT
ncbi:unnamed protein product [Cochlearia groenlandica]